MLLEKELKHRRDWNGWFVRFCKIFSGIVEKIFEILSLAIDAVSFHKFRVELSSTLLTD